MSSFDSSPKLRGGLPPTKMEPDSREYWQSLLGKLLKTPQEVVVHTCVRETPPGAPMEGSLSVWHAKMRSHLAMVDPSAKVGLGNQQNNFVVRNKSTASHGKEVLSMKKA